MSRNKIFGNEHLANLTSIVLARHCPAHTSCPFQIEIPTMLNEYEQRREARIARNRDILLRLVGDLPNALMGDRGGESLKPKSQGKRKPSVKNVIPEEDQRRSGRIRNLPAPIYTSFEVDEDLGDANARAARRQARRAKNGSQARSGGPKDLLTTVKKQSKPPAPPTKGSIKTLNARINECAANRLGRPISDGTGALKAAVIHELSPTSNPRFSKYSGIQEWKNAVCLFVNVGDKHGNSYDNVFTHAGGQVSWFAQPKQHEETPVIARILETLEDRFDKVQDATSCLRLGGDVEIDDEDASEQKNKKAKTESNSKSKPGIQKPVWPLHLFARMEGFEYVYCGRLRVLEHFPHKQPMKFLFRLLDAPVLRNSDNFLGLVDLADADASLGKHKTKASAASKKMLERKEGVLK